MLTQEDIQKIVEANREVFISKDDFTGAKKELQEADTKILNEIFTTQKDLEEFRDEMREMISTLQSSVDAYAQKADGYFQEMLMLSKKVDRHEKWLLSMADKLGMKLEY